MFKEELNDMDVMDQNYWDDVDGIADMEGQLIFALAYLDDSE